MSGIRTRLPRARRRVLAGALVWVVLVFGGLLVLVDHASAPGAAALAPVRWPGDSVLARDDRRPTLVALLHPKCPCSRATAVELQRLVARLPHRLAIDIVLLQPAAGEEPWNDSAMRASLAGLPDVHVYGDPGGVESTRFGARTSGQLLLYDSGGALRFAGGITPARAHEGDTYGADAIVDAVLSARDVDGVDPHMATSPVFGCSLGTAPSGRAAGRAAS
ncbi:RedB protein [Candidatus Binatia bacterium]|nr:RedB protein [Candidatus Binatia bacterium]